MLEHVFDPDAQSQPLTVRVQPGVIRLGETNFLCPDEFSGLDLTPIRAALLVLMLTRAIEAEMTYSTELEQALRARRAGDQGGDVWGVF